MAQTLEHNSAVETVTAVALPTFDGDVSNIQKLDDEPNDVGGLTAAQLKAEFDKGNEDIVEYINNTLVPAVLAQDSTEEARQQAEGERVANEIERVSNENARISAEQQRVSAETARASAETRRASAEGDRADAETTRADNESTRVSNEQTRVTAETGRASAEESRISHESARIDAERGRVSAESFRVTRESARVSAETERATAEQSRASAETRRASAEGDRADAETTRADNESTRVSNEQTRASNESARISAEQTRQTNEAIRQDAETGYIAQARGAAEDSEAWAVGKRGGTDVPSSDETYHNNAKYWAGEAQHAAQGGVSSFNGRSGSVEPQQGDYTAAMVGARPDTWMPTAAMVGADPAGTAASAASAHNAAADAHSALFGAKADASALTSHTGNTTAHITASERTAWNAKSAKALAFTVTLSASGWSNNAQTVSSANFVVSGCSYVVSPASASLEAYAEAQIYADNVTTAGRMTFHCGEVPSAALTVNVIRVEVTA